MSIQSTQSIKFGLTPSGAFTNITNYLEFQGFKIETSDLESSNQVTTMSGTIYRGKYAERNEITLTFKALTTSELVTIENFLKQQYFYIKYIDPKTGEEKTSQVYCSKRPRNHLAQKTNSIIWGGLAVTLTERYATN